MPYISIVLDCDSREYSAVTPVKVGRIDLAALGIDTVDSQTVRISQFDSEAGEYCVFDPEKSGNSAYALPFRFDCEHNNGEALPTCGVCGMLTVLPAKITGKIELHIRAVSEEEQAESVFQYCGLVGDGDPFVQDRGRLAVSGISNPVYYGSELFGIPGVLVAGAYHTGCTFFAEHASEDGKIFFTGSGNVKDSLGRPITGTVCAADLESDGRLGLLAGKSDGTIEFYKNIGSGTAVSFASPKELCYADSTPIDCSKYLRGITVPVTDRHGNVTPHYPEKTLLHEHGGKASLIVCPLLFTVEKTQNRYLLVATSGGFILAFRQTGQGFSQGEFVKTPDGKRLRAGNFISDIPSEDGANQNLIAGSMLGNVYFLKFESETGSGLIFSFPQKINLDEYVEYSCPLVCRRHGKLQLMLGNIYGEVRAQTFLDNSNSKTLNAGGSEYLQMHHAPVTRYLPRAVYADITGSGRMDLVSGDVKGGIFYYRNRNTKRNPLFESGRLLQVASGSIKIDNGPDPACRKDGYSKVELCDITGNGLSDLLCGSGLGYVYWFENMGTDEKGEPVFSDAKLLEDICGNPVRCHHMSCVLCTDWDGDGIPDLIVGGQARVHNHPDDDLCPSQLRWYKGVREGRRLTFEPYRALTLEGDSKICYRPFPMSIRESGGKKFLDVSWLCLEQADKNHPEKLFFAEQALPKLSYGEKDIVPAYHSLAQLAENDSAYVQGTCIGTLYAFRETFIRHGYLQARGSIHLVSEDDKETIINEIICPATPASNALPERKITRDLHVDFLHEKTAKNCNLTDSEQLWDLVSLTQFPPLAGQDNALLPSAGIVRYRSDLFFCVNIPEPHMDRMICENKTANGPVWDGDDRIALLLSAECSGFFERLDINANGIFRHVQQNIITGMLRRSEAVFARDRLKINTVKKDNGWQLFLQIPFEMFPQVLQAGEICHCEIQRVRSLYANKIPAMEQRLTENYYWSGSSCGLVRLHL